MLAWPSVKMNKFTGYFQRYTISKDKLRLLFELLKIQDCHDIWEYVSPRYLHSPHSTSSEFFSCPLLGPMLRHDRIIWMFGWAFQKNSRIRRSEIRLNKPSTLKGRRLCIVSTGNCRSVGESLDLDAVFGVPNLTIFGLSYERILYVEVYIFRLT